MKKKMLFSFMFIMICLTTMVVTTYAWVGILSNTTFDQVTINLKEEDEKGDYGIQLSLSGRPGTFHDSIDEIDIKKQLLINLGYSPSLLSSNDKIRDYFSRIRLSQATPDLSLDQSTAFDKPTVQSFVNPITNAHNVKLYWFDLYMILYQMNGQADSDNELDIYLRSLFDSDENYSVKLLNPIAYPNDTEAFSILTGNILPGAIIRDRVTVNPANACRLAIQKFAPVDMYNIVSNQNLLKSYIYQRGSLIPIYDSVKNEYDFGGILPENYNFAYQYYNSIHVDNPLPLIPSWQFSRGDIIYKDDGVTNHIVTKEDGVTTSKMIQLRIYFWFEGWDSNCFDVIDDHPVSINLTFSNKSPKDV